MMKPLSTGPSDNHQYRRRIGENFSAQGFYKDFHKICGYVLNG